MIYNEQNNRQQLSRIMALTAEHNQHELTKPCDEPKCMMERAQHYAATGETALAREHFLKAIGMPMDNELKVKAHEEYARFLSQTKDYQAAAEHQLTAANTRRLIDASATEAYARLLFAAALYSLLGERYQQAVDCYQGVLDAYRPLTSEAARKNEAKCWQGMGDALKLMKQYAEAKRYYQLAADYHERWCPADEEYPKAILRVATVEKFAGDYDASIAHHRQAMRLFEERGMAREYAEAANSLKLCYAYAGRRMPDGESAAMTQAAKAAERKKLNEIIQSELEALEITRQYLGKLAYARSLAVVGGSYAMLEQAVKAVDYYRQYIGAIREAVRDEFRLQGEAERMATWREDASTIREMQELLLMPFDANSTLRGSLAAVAYDAALLSKGILLRSAIEFEKVLRQQGKPELMAIYEQTKALEGEISRLRANPSTDADLERILQLARQMQTLQLQLYNSCAEYADFTNYISYDWKSVQRELAEGDIAIEFTNVDGLPGDRDDAMVAILLTRGMAQPEYVVLWGEEEMPADAALHSRVWPALSSHLQGMRRIFFSADGCFNRIAIEYMPYEGKPLSEQFEVYRLSSTKELCYKRKAATPQYAVLFGDINYNAGAATSAQAQRTVGAVRGAGAASGLANLENTLREVNEIQKILKGKGLKAAERLRDTDASRGAFLSLSDSKVNLLHVATHGLYRDEHRSTEAESMQNSLLAFAGANLGDGIHPNDSAFVTAADIASMNLRQCDLAVLSACETALGKLGGDGVFGLQRGFKNAGVHTLLMSLKNVYDASTADLMISFYQHLMQGSSKRQSLIQAQQDIRQKGFTDPQYWAVFILLDALD